MRLKLFSSVIFLLPVSMIPASMVYADTPVAADSQQVCESRINSFKTSLQASIDAKQNADEAKAELEQINKLPSSLSPCEKQKRIPSLANDEGSKQKKEAQRIGTSSSASAK